MKKTILSALLAVSCASAFAADYYIVVPVKKTEEAMNKNISVVLNAVPLPSGLAGQVYSGFDFMPALRITGDPKLDLRGVTWRVVSGALPAGLALGADGKLTGTPAAAGTANFQLMASYKTKSGSQAYQVVVGEIVVGLADSALPSGVLGSAYYFDLAPSLRVSGDSQYTPAATTWSAQSGLPQGLHLSQAGAITGTPTSSGVSNIMVQANYRGIVASRSYPLTIQVPAPDLRLESSAASSYTFASNLLGSESPAQSIAVTNAGTASGSLALATFAGANPTDFAATSMCVNVAPAATCQVHVTFKPSAAGPRTATLNLAGATLTFSGTGAAAPKQYVILATGTTYKIPAGVTTISASVVGGGGGGGGAGLAYNFYSGAGGGAGGIAQLAFDVTPGGTLNYTIGAGGSGGYGPFQGSSGGASTLNYQSVNLRATGGNGGLNVSSGTVATPGGVGTGGTSYPGGMGGRGGVVTGAGGGGAIAGVASVQSPNYNGSNGATSTFAAAAIAAAGQSIGHAGLGAEHTGTMANEQGQSASGFGHGGGGGAMYSGTGGNGARGGGGGGAQAYEQNLPGGNGGAGFIVLQLN